ncbi:MAG: SBBP repeat-containing protein, partial [Candidatus Binatia bacterium]
MPPLRIADNGDLLLQTAGGELRLRKPVVYQEIDGIRHPIAGHYVLLEPRQSDSPSLTLEPRTLNPEVGFAIASYDPDKSLVIDPVLEYSTYLGGSNYETGIDIAVDAAGHAYVIGETESSNFPTMNPLQKVQEGNARDAFIVKLDPTGSSLMYATYLGGSSNDFGFGIAVDASGNAHVTGWTESTNFPTTAQTLQAARGGGERDAFLAKLNATGSALLYSTYLGGSSNDFGSGIAVDAAGNAYVAGRTDSPDFATVTPLQSTKKGNFDAFVVKCNTT